MTYDVILGLLRRIAVAVSGDQTETIAATANANLGAMVVIQGEVPVEGSFRPVARLSDGNDSRTPHDVEVRRPSPTRAFGEVDVLGRMLIMEVTRRIMIPAITMPGTSCDELSSATVRQNVPSVACVIPVMVIDDNLCVDAVLTESRTEIILDNVSLSFPAEQHGGVRGVGVLGFVLNGDGVNLNPFVLVGLNEFDKVCSVSLLVVAALAKLPSEERICRLHPRRCCPGRGHDFEAGVDVQRLFEDWNDEILVLLNGEANHVKVILLAGLEIVVGVWLYRLKVGSTHWQP